MFLVYNSDVLAETDFRVSANERAFQYGDGLFETIRYERGEIWFWSDHMARLFAGMGALHLQPDSDINKSILYQSVMELLTANKLTAGPARIKIQVWRRTGGLYTPTTNGINVLITAQQGQPFAITEQANVGIYEDVRLVYSPFSAFKTLSSLPYVLAGLTKKERGLGDVILLNTDPDKYLAECLASNLFWFDDGVLFTPAVETGCINGILRQHILRTAAAVGQPVNIGFHQPNCLKFAEAVFCCNVNGVQWFRSIDGVGTFPAGHERADALFKELL